MKIGITGSRGFCDRGFVVSQIRSIALPGDVLVVGGAIGVDTWAEEALPTLNAELAVLGCGPVEKILFKPEYDKYGKSACAIRNKKIVDTADIILAFWDGQSKGTKMTIDFALQSKKAVNVYIRQN